jgi:Leucine-rich repeat (LRR) protein
MRLSIILILPVLLFNGCTWEDQYYLWTNKPEPYGGLDALNLIKIAKDTNATKLLVNRRNISDITPLEGLTNLKELNLWINNISDLTPLAGLTNLTMLNLQENNISDITPLAGLTNLTMLNLFRNNISDVTPLAGLTNLEWLYLSENNISESQKAMLEEALPNTKIFW